jgi:hypothetical protein
VYRELNVSSWVVIRKGCPIAHSVHNEGEVEFRLGTRWDGFEFVFEVDALRAFVEAAQDAIAEVPVEASGVAGGRHLLKSQ